MTRSGSGTCSQTEGIAGTGVGLRHHRHHVSSVRHDHDQRAQSRHPDGLALRPRGCRAATGHSLPGHLTSIRWPSLTRSSSTTRSSSWSRSMPPRRRTRTSDPFSERRRGGGDRADRATPRGTRWHRLRAPLKAPPRRLIPHPGHLQGNVPKRPGSAVSVPLDPLANQHPYPAGNPICLTRAAPGARAEAGTLWDVRLAAPWCVQSVAACCCCRDAATSGLSQRSARVLR